MRVLLDRVKISNLHWINNDAAADYLYEQAAQCVDYLNHRTHLDAVNRT